MRNQEWGPPVGLIACVAAIVLSLALGVRPKLQAQAEAQSTLGPMHVGQVQVAPGLMLYRAGDNQTICYIALSVNNVGFPVGEPTMQCATMLRRD